MEEKQYDPNYPSKDGWRPVHLCISNKIGSKAQECLLYLINKGADINVYAHNLAFHNKILFKN